MAWTFGSLVRLAAAVAAALAAQFPAPALAAPPWADKPFRYVVVDQEVRQVLETFARSVGTPLSLTDGVGGRLHRARAEGSAQAFLDDLAAQLDLVWFYDSSVLHVGTGKEVITGVLDAGDLPLSRIAASLDQLGLRDPRFALRASAGSQLVAVSGLPDYVALVARTVDALKAVRPAPVRVFRGTQAGNEF